MSDFVVILTSSESRLAKSSGACHRTAPKSRPTLLFSWLDNVEREKLEMQALPEAETRTFACEGGVSSEAPKLKHSSEKKAYPLEVAMDYAIVVEIRQTCCNI
jgi:hypothetical protein